MSSHGIGDVSRGSPCVEVDVTGVWTQDGRWEDAKSDEDEGADAKKDDQKMIARDDAKDAGTDEKKAPDKHEQRTAKNEQRTAKKEEKDGQKEEDKDGQKDAKKDKTKGDTGAGSAGKPDEDASNGAGGSAGADADDAGANRASAASEPMDVDADAAPLDYSAQAKKDEAIQACAGGKVLRSPGRNRGKDDNARDRKSVANGGRVGVGGVGGDSGGRRLSSPARASRKKAAVAAESKPSPPGKLRPELSVSIPAGEETGTVAEQADGGSPSGVVGRGHGDAVGNGANANGSGDARGGDAAVRESSSPGVGSSAGRKRTRARWLTENSSSAAVDKVSRFQYTGGKYAASLCRGEGGSLPAAMPGCAVVPYRKRACPGLFVIILPRGSPFVPWCLTASGLPVIPWIIGYFSPTDST